MLDPTQSSNYQIHEEKWEPEEGAEGGYQPIEGAPLELQRISQRIHELEESIHRAHIEWNNIEGTAKLYLGGFHPVNKVKDTLHDICNRCQALEAQLLEFGQQYNILLQKFCCECSADHQGNPFWEVNGLYIRRFEAIHKSLDFHGDIRSLVDKVQPHIVILQPRDLEGHKVCVSLDNLPWKFPYGFFGREDWDKLMGPVDRQRQFDIGEQFKQMLLMPCPFSIGKTVGETHAVVYIPQVVGCPPTTLSIRSFLEKIGYRIDWKLYQSRGPHFNVDKVKNTAHRSCWMFAKILEYNANDFPQSELLLKEKGYQLPDCLEAIVGLHFGIFRRAIPITENGVPPSVYYVAKMGINRGVFIEGKEENENARWGFVGKPDSTQRVIEITDKDSVSDKAYIVAVKHDWLWW